MSGKTLVLVAIGRSKSGYCPVCQHYGRINVIEKHNMTISYYRDCGHTVKRVK